MVDNTGVEELFGVLFQSGPSQIEFGLEATVELLPVIYPNSAYDSLEPGALFVIREGEKVVGRGRVIRRKCPRHLDPEAWLPWLRSSWPPHVNPSGEL